MCMVLKAAEESSVLFKMSDRGSLVSLERWYVRDPSEVDGGDRAAAWAVLAQGGRYPWMAWSDWRRVHTEHPEVTGTALDACRAVVLARGAARSMNPWQTIYFGSAPYLGGSTSSAGSLFNSSPPAGSSPADSESASASNQSADVCQPRAASS